MQYLTLKDVADFIWAAGFIFATYVSYIKTKSACSNKRSK